MAARPNQLTSICTRSSIWALCSLFPSHFPNSCSPRNQHPHWYTWSTLWFDPWWGSCDPNQTSKETVELIYNRIAAASNTIEIALTYDRSLFLILLMQSQGSTCMASVARSGILATLLPCESNFERSRVSEMAQKVYYSSERSVAFNQLLRDSFYD